MCNFQGYSGTTTYPDLDCVDGYLYDADNCEHNKDGTITYFGEPKGRCPECNPGKEGNDE